VTEASQLWTRRDSAVCAGFVALAALPRFWGLGRLGLTHFDEGAYTLAARWIATLGHQGAPYDPIRAPALTSALEGLSFVIFGVHDWAAIAVSAAAGSLAVGLLYAIGRRWFGTGVGAAAATLLATAEYHVIFSRLALADATFTLLFWTALAAAFEAVRRGGTRRYVVAGAVAGLSMNAKYNGFLPLASAAAWAVLARLRIITEPLPARTVRGLVIATGVAGALYLPWAAVVQFKSGYGTLLRAHAEHSLGAGLFPTTPPVLWFYFSHWLSPPLLVAAVVGIVMAFYRREAVETFLLATVAVFVAFLSIYLSFPRLALPLVPAACLFAALGVDAIARAVAPWRRAAILATIAALVSVWNLAGAADTLAMRTDAYRQAADYVRGDGLPVLSQMSGCYYFYEDVRSKEIRFLGSDELDAIVASSPEVIVIVDPIVERLPHAKAWVERTCAGLSPERVIAISMYEPLYYQGFDPNRGLDDVPRSYAPFLPGESEIRIYRVSR
jgi:4-amino-4-deoxy-L-arabinose transferase-like glycosyltransferase